MVDLVALLVLGLAAWTGWRRGTVPMALSLLGMVGGYAGALLLYKPFGALCQHVFGVPPLIAMPLGGMAALFVVSIVLRIITWRINRVIALKRAAGWYPSRPDRAGGALLASLWALGFIVAIAWLMMALRSVAHAGPDVAQSVTGRVSAAITRRIAFAATRRIAGDPLVANVGALLAADPARGAASLRALATDPRVRALIADESLRAALARGDRATLARSAAVRALATDSALHRAATDAGLISGDPGVDAVASDLADRAAPLARAVQTMRTDPEMQRLMRDPEMQRRLASGNVEALLRDPDMSRLVSRMLEILRASNPR